VFAQSFDKVVSIHLLEILSGRESKSSASG
jgi:hypothetical protein